MQGPFAVLFITFWIVVGFILLIGLFSGFFTVQQQSRAIVERFGRYLRTAKPGLNFKVPYIDYVVQRVSLRVQQLPVEVETKTLDNVFVKLLVAVQFRVTEGSEADSYYKLQDHVEQIKSFVLDVVRAKVPKMTLDEVFEKKDDVGLAVKSELDASMKIYGFEIPNALVTDVNPADNVKAAMNDIQTQQRLQIAAAAKGEANKILVDQERRSRSGIEAPAGRRHRQGAPRHHRRSARIHRGLHRSDRRRLGAGSPEARAAHAIFRHDEGHRRVGGQQGDPDAAFSRRHERYRRTIADGHHRGQRSGEDREIVLSLPGARWVRLLPHRQRRAAS